MVIENNKPLSIVEAREFVKKEKDSEANIIGFIKKFKQIDLKNTKELKKKIQSLNLIKINEKHLVKIIDLLPENPEELNKIFNDISLNEDEINKILEIIKEYK